MNILPLDVCDVSPQNKYEIIKYLLSTDAHSRNETADAINLSSVTVGKIASAMLSRNILKSERMSGPKGRSTELLYASPDLSILCITLNETTFVASLVTLDGVEKQITKRPKNDSFEYAEDTCIFIASVQRKIANIQNSQIIGVFVAYSYKSPKKLGVNVGMLLGIEPDVIISADEAIGTAFAHRKDCDVALHINIDYRIRPNLYVNGKNISEKAIGLAPDEQNEYAIALELSKYLSNLFKTVIPNAISINSEAVTADKRFFEFVNNNVSKITKIPTNDLPAVIDQRNISLIAEAALHLITELYIKRLANIS